MTRLVSRGNGTTDSLPHMPPSPRTLRLGMSSLGLAHCVSRHLRARGVEVELDIGEEGGPATLTITPPPGVSLRSRSDWRASMVASIKALDPLAGRLQGGTRAVRKSVRVEGPRLATSARRASSPMKGLLA